MNSFIPVASNRPGLRLAAAVACAALTLGGCGGDDDDDEASGEAPTRTTATTAADRPVAETTPQTDVVVQMTDAFRFDPPEIVLRVGGRITWTNPSIAVHTATGDPGKVADPSNVQLPEGAVPWNPEFVQGRESFAHTFTVPGRYRYACIPHAPLKMVGTITVVP